jgi:hypothetical protein
MKKKFITTVLTFIFIISGLSFLTCTQTNQPEGVDISLVVPGEGMDGVKLGDTKDSVLAKLGDEYSAVMTDSSFRSWLTYLYDKEPHAGLQIHFIKNSNGAYGIVDLIAAGTSSYNNRLYAGKTQDGIGIGSALTDVHNKYGLPDIDDNGDNWIKEFYCIGQKKFEVDYEDSVVTRLAIGYYKSVSGDSWYPCE